MTLINTTIPSRKQTDPKDWLIHQFIATLSELIVDLRQPGPLSLKRQSMMLKSAEETIETARKVIYGQDAKV